jgi:hypothetical protein
MQMNPWITDQLARERGEQLRRRAEAYRMRADAGIGFHPLSAVIHKVRLSHRADGLATSPAAVSRARPQGEAARSRVPSAIR